MKTIIEMARDAGIRDCICNGTMGCLKRFAELIRADEREACAKVCEDLETSGDAEFYGHVFAYAIRARGNT